MRFINGLTRILSRMERSLLVFLVGVMVVLAFLQVVLRNLFSTGLLWADPLLRYIVLWAGFLGAVLATEQAAHFRIDFAERFLPNKILKPLKWLVNVFAAGLACVLTHAAYQFLTNGIGAEEQDLFGLPKRLFFTILPIGFGLIALHFALHAVRQAAGESKHP